MGNKTPLFLMELLILVLVFAIAGTACLTAFVRADALSREAARTDRAVILARNAAQTLQATGGDTRAALPADTGELDMEILILDPGIPGLGQARIRVTFEDQELICLTVSWQEVAP